jgi:glutamate carboxypeptidase
VKAILDFCESHQPWALDLVRSLAALESPTTDKAAVDQCGAEVERQMLAFGSVVQRVTSASTGDHLVGRVGGSAPRILLLGHIDTVWAVGRLAEMPLRFDGSRLFGPGVFDMKGGLVIALLAVRALVELRRLPPAGVAMLWTADEETGSATSRRLVEELAVGCDAVLVFEPALTGGALKTSRKGCAQFELRVDGEAAHAGLDPQKGASAIRAMAQLVLDAYALEDSSSGVTVNVGLVTGGTRSNVVAESARAAVDVRFRTAEAGSAVERRVQNLRTSVPGTRVSVAGGIERPPLERTAPVARLYESARQVAAELGRDGLGEGATGGGSDGNFTAALGVPTLDGLGAIGRGAHAREESIEASALGWRAALAAGLIMRIAAR